jgi:PAS domain S-box-containing protein
VFGLFDSLLGYGIVGGRLMSLEEQGREAAAIALRIMGGESPASIPFGGEQAYVNAYDWRQLRRWSLSEDALPKGSIIINREFTLWDFRFYILGAMAFGLGETVLIIFLIVQRRRKRAAEKALQKKTDELDQFFNISPDLLCIATTDGYFLRLNSAWERIFGYPREELLTKRLLSFVHPDDLDGTRQALSTLASQQEVFFFQNRYCCKDGTYRWLEWSSAPVGTMIYAAARDITERKQAEAEMALARAELLHVERSSRLGELTVSLAHELNQPLAAILSSAQAAIRFLQSPTPDLHLFRTILQNIIQDDKRAAGVITSLRAMMKREEREREPLDMNAVLDNVLTLFNAEAIVRNVTIERDFDKSLSPVLGDKIQLQQVLLNLIMNAAEAMAESSNEDEKRRIILGTKATDQGIQVTVRDFGPGIDPARRDNIWRPFFTTKSAGLGMGLGICRSIILSHHGRIWAENHPEGGAMFTFEIPVIRNQ